MKKFLSTIIFFILFFGINNAVFAQPKTESNNYLSIERESKILKSRLSDIYTGYEYKIKNIYNEPVLIENIDIWNNAKAQVAYLSVKKSNSETAKQTMQKGIQYALPTLATSVIVSAIAVPFTVMNNNMGNKGALSEAERFDSEHITNYTLKPNQELTIKTLAIKKYIPLIRLSFKNPLTDEKMTLEMN